MFPFLPEDQRGFAGVGTGLDAPQDAAPSTIPALQTPASGAAAWSPSPASQWHLAETFHVSKSGSQHMDNYKAAHLRAL